MLYVVETFSGIGSQAKALKRKDIEYQVLATCDWDINAVIAYDLIHNGPQDLSEWENCDEKEINKLILPLPISGTSKTPLSESGKLGLSLETKKSLLSAIKRTNNQLDITKINGENLPDQTNLLTYSFPCQDLSLAGHWQGNEGGIDKNAKNRSSLLWQIERILEERNNAHHPLPRFLVMENVTNILSARHIDNFNLWRNTLSNLGYVNMVFSLDARNFGVPQSRVRTIMVSIHFNENNDLLKEEFLERFGNINQENMHEKYPAANGFTMRDVLKEDYKNPKYSKEAKYSNPNNTISRREIRKHNVFIDVNTEFVSTITTKQDRHPNSGLIKYPDHEEGKVDFRYLTPRECFILMGFDEKDYDQIIDSKLKNRGKEFFSRDKLNRLAGNSICVNVLESVFAMIDEMNNFIDEHNEMNV